MNLLPNTDDFIKIIRENAKIAFDASKPSNTVFGKVVSANPLQIKIDQKLTLTMAQLVLTRNVTDYTVSMTVDHTVREALSGVDLAHQHNYNGTTKESELHTHSYQGTTEENGTKDLTHSHSYEGTKQFLVHNSLKIGEDVIMMQMQGGQKFIVIDRVVV